MGARRGLLVAATMLLAPAALVPVGPADAGHRGVPQIDLVAPMRAPVGSEIVIRGRHFSRQTRRSTVIFRGPGDRAAFARPVRAFPRKLVVRVPTTVEAMMRSAPGDETAKLPTRFRLRIVSNRRRSSLTGPRRSPLIVPASSADAPAP